MKLRSLLFTVLIFGGLASALQAVEMFTHFRDGEKLGFESLNSVKRTYPGYQLPNGQRMPVAAPYFYPANGSHPWNWHAAARPMVGLPLHAAPAAPGQQPHNPYTKLPLPQREAAPLPAKVIGQYGSP